MNNFHKWNKSQGKKVILNNKVLNDFSLRKKLISGEKRIGFKTVFRNHWMENKPNVNDLKGEENKIAINFDQICVNAFLTIQLMFIHTKITPNAVLQHFSRYLRLFRVSFGMILLDLRMSFFGIKVGRPSGLMFPNQ